MTEFFQNKFVIKIESGHPGYKQYTVIATRENMNQMVQELSQALAQLEKISQHFSSQVRAYISYGRSTPRLHLARLRAFTSSLRLLLIWMFFMFLLSVLATCPSI